jgi:hypothetical protein
MGCPDDSPQSTQKPQRVLRKWVTAEIYAVSGTVKTPGTSREVSWDERAWKGNQRDVRAMIGV